MHLRLFLWKMLDSHQVFLMAIFYVSKRFSFFIDCFVPFVENQLMLIALLLGMHADQTI